MQYRKFGKLNWQVSALGFGCMRLPIIGNNSANINEPEATRMLHVAIDQGVNYVDTAYPYHGGNSERVVGRALKGGYREKVKLATKMPTWLTNAYNDFDKYLNEQLQKLQTDHIDFYLLHALGAERWQQMKALNVLEWAEKAIADGRIRHLGFSFHDNYPAFEEIVDGYDKWTFCQIQYNYMDTENQAGVKGLHYAAAKGLAVVIMEPLLGGKLVNPPPVIQQIWDNAPQKRTPADWALQWIWSQPEVATILGGMSTMEQVQENLASANESPLQLPAGALELKLFDEVRLKYQELSPIPCTSCEYCLPCPNGVNIPRVFGVYNEGVMYDKIDQSRQAYAMWIPQPERAEACIQCLECEQLCPQKIAISDWMAHIQAVLGEGKAIADVPRP
jgi:uncharacterized protein